MCCIIATFYLNSRVVKKALCEGLVPVLGVGSLELDFWCFRFYYSKFMSSIQLKELIL